ncbi:MAG TPA: GNAT family N-acetyltransferase [Longimicrobiales bacterium]
MTEFKNEGIAAEHVTIVVRLMGQGDALVATRSLRALGRHIDEAAVVEYLRSDDDVLVIAFINEIPAGFARGHCLRRLDGVRPKFMLYEIETALPFRRRGVARALMENMLDVARSLHSLNLFVLTDEANAAAMALYHSTGGRRPRPDDVLFEFELH